MLEGEGEQDYLNHVSKRVRNKSELHDELARALDHFGPVVMPDWHTVFANKIEPRASRFFAIHFRDAETLPWPKEPVPTVPTTAGPPDLESRGVSPPTPEKVAGGTTTDCPVCGATCHGHTGYYDPATDILVCLNCHPPTIVHNFLAKKMANG